MELSSVFCGYGLQPSIYYRVCSCLQWHESLRLRDVNVGAEFRVFGSRFCVLEVEGVYEHTPELQAPSILKGSWAVTGDKVAAVVLQIRLLQSLFRTTREPSSNRY